MPTHPMTHCAALLFALFLVACADSGATDDTSDLGSDVADVTDGADTIADTDTHTTGYAYKPFEFTLDVDLTSFANPFDPNQLDARVEFESPAGVLYTVPAFVYRPFERVLDDGQNPRERLTATGPLELRVRFRPPFGDPEGVWRWRSVITTDTRRESTWNDVSATRDEAGRGVLRVSPHDHRYLAFEDGSPYLAIGENMAWYDGRGTFAYDQWLERLAASGGNYIRVWMPSWAFGLEWVSREGDTLIDSSLGDYTARLDRAWQLDHVLGRAEALGIQVMLTIQNHGPFSTLHAGQWPDNPYNQVNGGPLATPTDFFVDPVARELFERRLRYIVARWGHHPNLFCWELWNEVDLVTDPNTPEVSAWTRDMAKVLRDLDPVDRLISTSLGGVEPLAAWLENNVAAIAERQPFWNLAELDFTQLHLYGFATLELDFTETLLAFATALHTFDKPTLIAEAGVSAVSAEDSLLQDPDGIGFHDIVWGGVFAGAFGSGMNWWWDHLTDPQDYYVHFASLAELTRGVVFDREAFKASVAETPDLVTHLLEGRTTTLAWLRQPGHQWFAPDLTSVMGATLTLELDGRYQATWLDPWDRETISIFEISGSGPAALDVPPFSRDLALRLTRL